MLFKTPCKKERHLCREVRSVKAELVGRVHFEDGDDVIKMEVQYEGSL